LFYGKRDKRRGGKGLLTANRPTSDDRCHPIRKKTRQCFQQYDKREGLNTGRLYMHYFENTNIFYL
jgi:hypothetical protein